MSRPLLTHDDVNEWRERYREIEATEVRLREEKSEIKKKLAAVEFLIGDIEEERPAAPQDDASSANLRTTTRDGKPTWPSEIERIFGELRKPMSYDELRLELEKGPLAGEYEKSEKGFYHAVSRLQSRGFLTKHKGWLFRCVDLERHLEDVRAGRVKDVSLAPKRGKSPMGEEVKVFLASRPQGSESKDVISHLIKDSRFVETLSKNTTGGYNVISRLVKRGEIRKEGKLLYPLNDNEPPEGDSFNGAATSLFSQPGGNTQ